ncbi:LysR family transcriptional regulator [Aliiroseovarius sp.]|uniref:LysR family transcriptional regulator n=1 Tax=Aliiroseovarius sp. TaxID=1872442 RepID=UPI00262440D9|nr:LysR family transcriptional regulator [Aliiroseovarius sp.]
MQIDALETFLAIARGGSFHAAAREQNVTQTAVSARIRTLERALGVSLFDRGPAGARLSPSGQQLLPHAEQMLRSWEAVQNGLAGNRAALRLGTQLSIWDGVLVDLAVWLERAQGQVPLTLNFDHSLDMGEAVRQGLLDIALAPEPVPGLGGERLADDVLVLVSDQPRALGEGAPLFINLELGAAYTAGWQAVIPAEARQHIVLGSARMGLDYLLKRGGIGYFPAAMVAGVRGLYPVVGAPELHLPCHVLFARRSGQIAPVLTGLAALRQAGTAAALTESSS